MAAVKKKRWPYVLGGILVLLIAIVAVVLWRLDAILLKAARDQAATYSQKLGRPIEIGDVSTKLFPYVGAHIQNVSVGAAEGEDLPLAEVKDVTVSVAAMPLLTSKGKDIRVQDAEVSGLTVNVIRLADGTTNVQRLQEKLAAQQPKEETPEEETQPTDLSGVHVERAALTDGTIRFVDRAGGAQARELAVKDLDIEVKDLRVGQPLKVDLAAAVLAEKQNLKMTLAAAPLPATLIPTPEQVTLKAEHIDLSPLGPFLPPDVGLQAGTLDADWKADLGGAVPGGKGPTKLVGVIKALGMKFAGSEGGKALDVVLDTDVTGDMATGDLALDKLKLDLGPAAITGKGKVKGLLTDKPAVEGFELTGRNLDPAVLAEYYPPLRKQLNGMIAGPIGLDVRGSGTQEAQAINIAVDLTPVRLRVPDQLSKEAGGAMKLNAKVTGAAASGGALRFDAKADLNGVDMRPGLLVNKAPGQRLEVAAAGTYAPAKTGSGMTVNVTSMSLGALEDTVTGTATVALAGTGKKATTTFKADVKAAKLDAEKLLMSEEQVLARTGGKPPPEPPPGEANRFNGYRGDIQFAIASLRYTAMDLTHVTGVVKMVDDLITVEKFSTGIYGGKVVADGTTIRLGPAPAARPFTAKVQVQGLEVAQALAARTPKQVLTGKFNGNVDVQGVGYTPDKLQQTLLGGINGNLLEGTFLGKDLVSSVTGPLAKAVPFAKALKSGDVTSLGANLPFSVTIKNGVAQLSKPITWTRPEAAMSFDGGIGLDGTLDLTGGVSLTPATIKTLTVGKVTPTEAIPVGLKISGKAWSPEVTGIDVKPAATTILKLAGGAALGGLLGEKGKAVENIITGGQDKAKAEAEAKRQELEARANEEKKKLEDQARIEQEKAKQRAEEEAKKRLKGIFGGK
ncbi:AsmA family protein [Corallococcus exiguus]|uniref:AsmA family protein n=1 Tax=Corallococcus TaxID=83461 RepID=UPI000ED0379C|nr:AsmA family protein [Corallococcus sp. AB032C]NNC06167.1 AsmA family protein [Corallococcus exiguus]NPC49664.1 AsmA family protein [Corallococcus exiguus]RKH77910.1 AsmA family protein [Corallococcus sp. AB032C]